MNNICQLAIPKIETVSYEVSTLKMRTNNTLYYYNQLWYM